MIFFIKNSISKNSQKENYQNGNFRGAISTSNQGQTLAIF